MRTQAEWKVETHIDRTAPPTRAPTRPFISLAALLVKVMARIESGGTRRSRIEMGDPICEHPGLARAGPGDHQDRALGSRYRFSLRGVEVGKERGLGRDIIEKPLSLHLPAMVPGGTD